MASGWDMGMELGVASISASASAPVSNSPACLYGLSSSATDALRVDDLLDFSNHDEFFSISSSSSSVAGEHHFLPPPSEASPFAVESDSPNFYGHPSCASFAADDIYIPSEEAAELEWLSRFVDDSFSDIPQTSYAHHAAKTPSFTGPPQHLHTNQQSSAPGRGARSKRSRGTTATANWSATAPRPPSQSSPSTPSSSSSSDFPITKQENSNDNNKNVDKNINNGKEKKGGVRRCTHCASEKTPQWRTGPMGPKTLCNACGVRYKSGRLVPEYRPAASPTFVLTQHSNSHRKVLELRRQKELLLHRGSGGSGAAAAGELIFHDYEVC